MSLNLIFLNNVYTWMCRVILFNALFKVHFWMNSRRFNLNICSVLDVYGPASTLVALALF